MQFLYERIRRLTRDLSTLRYPETLNLSDFRYKKLSDKLADVTSLDSSDWPVIEKNQVVRGDRYEYYYFVKEVTIPENFDGKTVAFHISTAQDGTWDSINPQLLLFVNGKLRLGFDEFHHEAILTEEAKAGETFKLVLQAFTGDGNFRMLLDTKLRVLDRQTEKYYYDVKVPLDIAQLLPFDSDVHYQIINALNESLNLLDLRIPGNKAYRKTLAIAQEYLDKNFYEKYGDENKTPLIYAVGHTHIDVAWLWTLAVTEDKTVRSFASVLELMREYPEYTFMSSTPQLYMYIEKHDPKLFKEIQERVAEGRWEVEGAMFLEADCNIASGEALVRQITGGKRYFKDKFNKTNEIFWLPDVFGYSAALPQILQQSGVPYFMTTKISWSETNKMPYDTFEWQGIDGSKVLTHFIPTREYGRKAIPGHFANAHFTTYNGDLTISQAMGSWERYTDKNLNDFVLMAYGHGDGGGGTTREMIENGRRLAKGLPGAPRLKFSTVTEFFKKLDETVSGNRHLPRWSGELYLEYHRGTYTSMGRNKKYNRRSEYALQNLEFYASLAGLLADAPYPTAILEEGWEILMRNQFHDILPGTSIKEVYDDSDREYARLADIVGSASSELQSKIVKAVGLGTKEIMIFNPTGFKQNGVVYLDEANVGVNKDGLAYPVQSTRDGRAFFFAKDVPAFGYAVYQLTDEISSAQDLGDVDPDGFVIENDFYKVEFNDLGQFRSIFDKQAMREVLKPGEAGNVIMSYEDRPHNYENWDINNYYVEKSWPVDGLTKFAVVENGPLRQTIRIERPYLDSTVTQEVHLYKDSPRIDIDHDIDWKQERIMMKALFPVNVYTHEATFEIQYGHVKRQTHHNTSWDEARFEVPVHKWLNVSEYGYGVSFLNDAKYGCHVRDSVVGLTLLKSGTDPHPKADQERHTFTLSLMAHTGTWQEAGVLAEAYNLNNPLLAVRGEEDSSNETKALYSFVRSKSPGATVEVVKKAEDSDNLIVRLYESYGQSENSSLELAFTPKRVVEVNLLEEEIQEATVDGQEIQFSLKPFEIKTFLIER